MPIIPLTCPNCGGNLTVDSSLEAAVCSHCKKPYIVKEAITKQYITNINNITADTVNVYSEKDFEINAGKLVKYNGESKCVQIPSTVKIIGGAAFKGTALESVEIPDSVIEIEESGRSKIYGGAFDGCKCLTRVKIPGSVETIGRDAFRECIHLQEVKLEEGIRQIGAYAFENCTALREIRIPASVKQIEEHAFAKCSALETVIFEGEVPRLGYRQIAFVKRDYESVFDGSPFCKAVMEKQAQEKAEQERKQKEEWRGKGVCQHCGSPFAGMFTKKCTKCGKQKDY